MSIIRVRRARPSEGRLLLSLINALADFEKLKRPSAAARKRLLRDAFGPRRRFEALLAFDEERPVGYAITFTTYSSFLALPTLYLEDIFVLPAYRRMGVGWQLFRACLQKAEKRGCGRMEWVVLDWNINAIGFYRRLGARRLRAWSPFRLERPQFRNLLARRTA